MAAYGSAIASAPDSYSGKSPLEGQVETRARTVAKLLGLDDGRATTARRTQQRRGRDGNLMTPAGALERAPTPAERKAITDEEKEEAH